MSPKNVLIDLMQIKCMYKIETTKGKIDFLLAVFNQYMRKGIDLQWLRYEQEKMSDITGIKLKYGRVFKETKFLGHKFRIHQNNEADYREVLLSFGKKILVIASQDTEQAKRKDILELSKRLEDIKERLDSEFASKF